MQEAKHLRDNERGGDGSDEGRTDRLAGEQGDAATIKLAVLQYLLVRRLCGEIFPIAAALPDFRRRPAGWQGVHADGAEVAVATAKPGLDDQREAGTVECNSA